MKKFVFISMILGSFISLTGCSHEIETFNDNPNNPTELSSAKTLLTGAEMGTIMNSTGDLPRLISMFTQHTNGNNFQSLDYTNYFITETDVESNWSNIYQAGINANQIITKFGANNPYYDGMAKVLLALNMGYATDIWGDIPFSEAFQGAAGNTSPKYDTQQQVIAKIQTYLDEAILNFAKPSSANLEIPGSDDIFYGGNLDKWTKLAYSIKARYALRLTQRDSGAAQKALNYVQNAMTSLDDNLVATFDGGNNQNLWFGFNNQRGGYMSMGAYFMDLMAAKSDPRIPFYAAPDSAGGYHGSAPEDEDVDASPFGAYFAGSPSTPNVIFSYSEVKFIEAEAQFRLGNTTAAQAALEQAVAASLTEVTGANNAAYVAANSSPTLENIISQKYIALFTTLEPYNDFRRTGFPVLTPNQNSQSKKIPVRLITPKSERTLNSNAVVVGSLDTPVWWDN